MKDRPRDRENTNKRREREERELEAQVQGGTAAQTQLITLWDQNTKIRMQGREGEGVPLG